jgi:hypothetical protein
MLPCLIGCPVRREPCGVSRIPQSGTTSGATSIATPGGLVRFIANSSRRAAFKQSMLSVEALQPPRQSVSSIPRRRKSCLQSQGPCRAGPRWPRLRQPADDGRPRCRHASRSSRVATTMSRLRRHTSRSAQRNTGSAVPRHDGAAPFCPISTSRSPTADGIRRPDAPNDGAGAWCPLRTSPA